MFSYTKILHHFKNKKSTLFGNHQVERFFKETMRIPRYAPRLDCMIFRGGFDRDVRDLSETLDIVGNACAQVKDLLYT